ncbi:hypothetical protein Pmani_008617 [Petrolisthes manimaculis]|uniref:C2H2-type domain-containing protein n=1 Tax=Petrolisthes manimaculis TaxID=1843537 RepID=A0AAE1UHK8_9EUCA|nr:hypothetical protein Pmani_008617 [Petrolisthes manimaculis]
MKLPKLFDGASFTRWGRSAPEHAGDDMNALSATESESSEEKSLVTPERDKGREVPGSFDTKSLSGSIVSFLSLHKIKKPENRSNEKMEGTWREMMSSVLSGFGRRASLRNQSEPEVSPKLRRSNTMPVRRPSKDGSRDDASISAVSQGHSSKQLSLARREQPSTYTLRTTGNALDSFNLSYTAIQTTRVTPDFHLSEDSWDRSEGKTSNASSHIESDLSRSSSVCTLRQEDFEHTSHYQSVSEAVSWCPSLTDLTSSDTTPTVSPYCTINSNRKISDCRIYHSPSSHQLPSNPTTTSSSSHPSSRNLASLLHLLNSLSDSRGENIQNINRDTTTSFSHITGRQYSVPQYSPSSSVTSSRDKCDRCGEGLQARSQGHTCPKCQVNFLTSDQLLEHWSIFHTHELWDVTLSPFHHHQWKKEEAREKKNLQTRGSVLKKPLDEDDRYSWRDAWTPPSPCWSPNAAVKVNKIIIPVMFMVHESSI